MTTKEKVICLIVTIALAAVDVGFVILGETLIPEIMASIYRMISCFMLGWITSMFLRYLFKKEN